MCPVGATTTLTVELTNTGNSAVNWTVVPHLAGDGVVKVLSSFPAEVGHKGYASAMAYDPSADCLWLMNSTAQELVKLRAPGGKNLSKVALPDTCPRPGGLMIAGDKLWVINSQAKNFTALALKDLAAAGTVPQPADWNGSAAGLAAGDGKWYATRTTSRGIFELDPATGKVVRELPAIPELPAIRRVGAGNGFLWTGKGNELCAVAPAGGQLCAAIAVADWIPGTTIMDVVPAKENGQLWLMTLNHTGTRQPWIHLLDLARVQRTTVSPSGGSLPPNGTIKVQMALDARDWPLGTHETKLIFSTGEAGTTPAMAAVTNVVHRAGANQSPVANAGADRTVRADVTVPVLLDGRKSKDPDGDPLRYAWSSKGNVLYQGSSFSHLIELPCGTHEFELTVDDFRGGSSKAKVKIMVANSAPTDWPQWYGQDGTGHSYEKDWLDNWPPVVLWTRPDIATGGYSGNSSPVVSEGRVYHCGNNRKVQCLNAATGQTIWEKEFFGGNATPAVDEAWVYTVGRDCKNVAVACWDKATGAEVWKTTVTVNAFDADGAGFSTSPMVYGDVLFLDGTALNKFSGAALWHRTPHSRATLAKYFTWNGRTYLLDDGVLIDWTNGKDVKALGLSTRWWLHSTTTYGNDKVWLVQSVKDIGTGATTWNTDLKLGGGAEMYVQPVVVGEHGYFVRGGHGAGGPLCALDMKTGKELWRGPRWCSWIAVGDKLLAHGGGQVAVIRTGTDKYEEEGAAYQFTSGGSSGYPLIAYSKKQFYVMARDGLTCLTTARAHPAIHNDNGAAWNPGPRTVRLNGYLENTGGKPTEVFIYWGNRDSGTDPAQWANCIKLGAKTPGLFSADTPALERNSMYFYRCSATNELGRGWAPETLRIATPDPVTLANDPALVLHWTCDAISGGKLADASPNGVTANLRKNSAGVVDGVIGKALGFVGNESLSSSGLQPPLRRDFTVTFWLRLAENYSGNRPFLELEPGRFGLGFKDLSPTLGSTAAKSALQPNRWYHLAVTRTGGQRMLYLDGAPATERSAGSEEPYDKLMLRFSGDGQLDDLRVYRRTLTADEIKQLATSAGKAGGAKPR
jgi:hypothetical protein